MQMQYDFWYWHNACTAQYTLLSHYHEFYYVSIEVKQLGFNLEGGGAQEAPPNKKKKKKRRRQLAIADNIIIMNTP